MSYFVEIETASSVYEVFTPEGRVFCLAQLSEEGIYGDPNISSFRGISGKYFYWPTSLKRKAINEQIILYWANRSHEAEMHKNDM